MGLLYKMKPTTDFGEWLRLKMFERYLTCADVARMLHSTRQTIATHINGTTPPSYVWVIAYCSIFNESPEKIWKLVKKDES